MKPRQPDPVKTVDQGANSDRRKFWEIGGQPYRMPPEAELTEWGHFLFQEVPR
jgi:hypothetical protein